MSDYKSLIDDKYFEQLAWFRHFGINVRVARCHLTICLASQFVCEQNRPLAMKSLIPNSISFHHNEIAASVEHTKMFCIFSTISDEIIGYP